MVVIVSFKLKSSVELLNQNRLIPSDRSLKNLHLSFYFRKKFMVSLKKPPFVCTRWQFAPLVSEKLLQLCSERISLSAVANFLIFLCQS